MVQRLVRYKKGIAIELRQKGFSYSEIKNSINIPKSTIAFWLKGIKLTDEQIKKLKNKRSEVARANSQKRVLKVSKAIEEIKVLSAKDIKEISKKELWLMGIVLYWRERFLHGHENDLRKGVRFTSSDPSLIKLFLKWLRDVGGIEDKEIYFDIFAGKNQKNSISKIISHWSEVTGFPKSYFSRTYFYKHKSGDFLRIRVKASSMLARQIAGWIEGIKQCFLE